MIDRQVVERRLSLGVRPTPPTARQEWLGIAVFSGLILFLDRYQTYVTFLPFAGLLYLIGIVVIACLSGLRAALACCAIITAYAWAVFHYHFSGAVQNYNQPDRRVIGTAILFTVFATTSGVFSNKLRASKMREFDARAKADEEELQRKAAEVELGLSEETRRLIVDSSIDAIIGVSDEGIINLWNPNAEKLFGWTREEAIGNPVAKRVISPRSSGSRQSVIRKFFESGEGPILREQIEITARTKHNKEISIELYIADHKTENGSLFIIFARDISDRKEAEKAIRDLNARLEERVVERTQQLEAANQELLGFTYSVSHDLRTPLRAIVSNSRIVREDTAGTITPETGEHLQRLEKNALKMAELIENLLQFARIGQVQMKLREVDITEMVDDIAAELMATRPGTITVQPGLTMRADPDMIRMVMFNLLENAWKYVRPGEQPNVEVGMTAEGTFFVKDEGIGFDMQYVDKIWEPFERLHRDSEYSGTGIGLANTRRILSRHGGRIWANSKPGEGTTMFFELPSTELAPVDSATAQASGSASSYPK